MIPDLKKDRVMVVLGKNFRKIKTPFEIALKMPVLVPQLMYYILKQKGRAHRNM